MARDAAFGGAKGFEKDGTVGNSGAIKLGIATIRAVFGPSERPAFAPDGRSGQKVPAPRVKWQRRNLE